MPRKIVLLTLTAVMLFAALLAAQTPEFDFYPEFRRWRQALPATTSQDAALEQYREKLRIEGTAAPEIDRRVTLIQTRRAELENDYWNRVFTVEKPTFNTEPNAFLVSVAEKRTVGKALDVGMGDGRNALYLAQLGWDVTGFDPADKAVALAAQRAQMLGVKLHTIVARDQDFDFGREMWDLILLPMNGLLKAFEALRILRYENALAPSDFFGRREMQVVRLLAEKPAH
jgi:methylase of polypeptide subunit release factors